MKLGLCKASVADLIQRRFGLIQWPNLRIESGDQFKGLNQFRKDLESFGDLGSPRLLQQGAVVTRGALSW